MPSILFAVFMLLIIAAATWHRKVERPATCSHGVVSTGWCDECESWRKLERSKAVNNGG